MSEVQSAHSMLTAYNAVAVRCWEDPGARERFVRAPRETLAAYGWEVPEDTRVTIEFVEGAEASRELSAEEVVTVWRRGLEAGDLRIKIADEPPDALSAELSAEELEAVSGGTYTAPSIYPP